MPEDYPLLDKNLDALRTARSDELQVNLDRINGEDVVRISEAIVKAPFLHKLHLTGGPIIDSATELLADAVATRSDIEDFGWISNRGEDTHLAKVIDALEPSKNLKSLYVTWSDANDVTMDAVIRRISDSPDFENLFASGGTWSQETHDKLAEAVKDKPSLITINTSKRGNVLDDTKLAEALVEHPHPNLLVPTGCHIQEVNQVASQNNESCAKVKDFFVFMPKEASAELIAEHITPELLLEIESRLPAMISYGAFNGNTDGHHLPAYLEMRDGLPKLEGKEMVDALFAPSEKGFSAMENPQTWRDNPNLLKQLQESGALTDDVLSKRTEKGNSLMDMAILHCPVKDVLPIFNEHGLKIRHEALFSEDGKPSPLLERLHRKHELPHIFTENNWAGASPSALQATVRNLPDNMRSGVPSLNALNQVLRASQNTGIGR